MTSFFDEVRQMNAEVERITRMIDQLRRAENSLREAHDERSSIGGGSRARLGNLLANAEDAVEFCRDEINRMQADYPGTTAGREEARVAS